MENNTEYLTYQLEEMYPAYQWIIHTKYKIPSKIIKGLGATEWYDLLHEIVGRFVTEKPGIAVDTFYQEISSMYPYLIDPEIINEEDQLYHLIDFERRYRSIKLRLEEITNA